MPFAAGKNGQRRVEYSYRTQHGELFSCVCRNVEQRSFQSFLHDSRTGLLISLESISKLCHFLGSVDVSGTERNIPGSPQT